MNNVTIEAESEIYKGSVSLKSAPKPEDKYVYQTQKVDTVSIIWKVSNFSSFFSFCFLLRIRFFLLTLQQS